MSSSNTTTTNNTPLILYDIPTKKPQYGCWSPNVWKTRLVLNYKRLPYTTHFLLHQSIAPTLSALSIPPNTPPPPSTPGPTPSAYTVPAISNLPGPGPPALMESSALASRLETLHPTPPLRLDTGLHLKIQPLLGAIALPLLPVLFPRIGRDVLRPEAYPTWLAKREAGFGCSLAEFEARGGPGGEAAWKAAEPGFAELGEFLRGNKRDPGPFLLGSRVCYGDFVLVAFLESARRIGEDVFARVVGVDPALRDLWEACAEWLVNDGLVGEAEEGERTKI